MKTVSVRLEWREEGKEVDSAEVAGDFNQWEKAPLFLQCEADESVWWTTLEILPGCYGYKFFVDGEWKNAPGAEVEKDDAGEMLSILIVEEDEEVENREDLVQQNESGQVELGLERSVGGGKVEEAIESLEDKNKGIENGEEESQVLDERNPRRAAVGTN